MFLSHARQMHKRALHRSLVSFGAIFFVCALVFAYARLAELYVKEKDVFAAHVLIPLALEPVNADGGDTFTPPKIEPPKLPILKEGVEELTYTGTAEGVLVKDTITGTVLYQKNAYTQHAMASITKLMSALVLLEQPMDWSTSTVVVADDVIDTHMYAGDTYTLEDLWNAALIASSNKAVLTLIDASPRTREVFVARMNEKAQELGMSDTVFVEPTGLDAGNISTPSDIAILINEALKQEKIASALTTVEYEIYSAERKSKHHMWNTNWLLLQWVPNTFERIYGGKTGYITASQYNFTTQVEDEKKRKITVVILGADTHEARFTEARDIANWVYDSYIWPGEKHVESLATEQEQI